MIIATIGHQQYKLKDIAAAEQLLKIFNDSLPVQEHYMRKSRTVFSILKSSSEMCLSIIQGEIISDEDLEELKDQELQKD